MFQKAKEQVQFSTLTADEVRAMGINGLTLQQAEIKGIISVEEDPNKLFRPHAEEDAVYICINKNRGIQLSTKLMESLQSEPFSSLAELVNRLAHCQIKLDVSTKEGPGKGKEYVRLSRPRNLNVGDYISVIKKETATN